MQSLKLNLRELFFALNAHTGSRFLASSRDQLLAPEAMAVVAARF